MKTCLKYYLAKVTELEAARKYSITIRRRDHKEGVSESWETNIFNCY